MADDDKRDAPPPATDFSPDPALADAEPTFESAADRASATAEPRRDAGARGGAINFDGGDLASADAIREQVQRLTQQAQDRVRTYAQDGKMRAAGALDEVVKMMNDAADTVDEKVGTQYGQYARSAADYVDGFAKSLDSKDIDDLVEDVRGLVQKSPAIAIGTAAAIGFVLARIVRSGIDADKPVA